MPALERENVRMYDVSLSLCANAGAEARPYLGANSEQLAHGVNYAPNVSSYAANTSQELNIFVLAQPREQARQRA